MLNFQGIQILNKFMSLEDLFSFHFTKQREEFKGVSKGCVTKTNCCIVTNGYSVQVIMFYTAEDNFHSRFIRLPVRNERTRIDFPMWTFFCLDFGKKKGRNEACRIGGLQYFWNNLWPHGPRGTQASARGLQARGLSAQLLALQGNLICMKY